MITSSRSRLVALAIVLAGAGIVWFNASEDVRNGTRSLALVALAAAGALLATRGRVRRGIAFVILFSGIGLALGGNWMAIISGLFVIAGGVLAVATCPTWPVMGVRFERGPVVDDLDIWAAMDRGEDPTAGTQPR